MTTVSNTASGDASLPLNIVTSRWDVADGHTLEAVSDDPEDPYFATDLFLTPQNGVWRVFR